MIDVVVVECDAERESEKVAISLLFCDLWCTYFMTRKARNFSIFSFFSKRRQARGERED